MKSEPKLRLNNRDFGLSLFCSERLKEFGMHTTKPSVAHDNDLVARIAFIDYCALWNLNAGCI
jgi:hypothetical protein